MYSSLGKIKSVVILNPAYDSLQNSIINAEYGVLYSRYRDYSHLHSILKREKIKLNIVFDFTSEETELVTKATKDFGWIKFIPIDPQLGINTQFVQDVLIFIENKDGTKTAIVCYDEKIYEKIALDICLLLKREFSFKYSTEQVKIGQKHIEGGNILRGLHQKSDFAIIGRLSEKYYSEAELSELLKIDEEKIFFFDLSKYLVDYSLITFHVDLFLMLGGPLKFRTFNQCEILFIGKAIGKPKPVVDKFNLAINQLWINDIKTCPIPFLPISLPVLVVPGDYFLSYCNCHVENYLTPEGFQIINMYLPDYRITLKEVYEKYDKSKLRPDLVDFVESLAVISNYGNEIDDLIPAFETDSRENKRLDTAAFSEEDIDFRINQAIENVQNEIYKSMLNFGINNVYFINGNYYEMVRDKRGSLHCMSLVTERGPHGFE